MTLDATLLRNFAIALFIGALVGIEREKRKDTDGDSGIGGLRTFIIIAEMGALAAWLSVENHAPVIFVGVAAIFGAILFAGYRAHTTVNPESAGLTTEVAAIAVYLLGGAVLFGHAEVAVALAITTSAVLAAKAPMHQTVAKLGSDDIFAGLKLLVATFIVLPLLPNQTMDPWGALNPYKLWWLVILISSLSLIGYVAVRWLGTERGLSVTGFFGGLVSSTAVTLSFSRRSKEEPQLADALATGILLAWGVMFVRVLVEVAVVNIALLPRVLIPMLTMGLVGLVVALLHYRAGRAATAKEGAPQDAAELPQSEQVKLQNPFSLTSAVKFGAFFAAVMLAVNIARDYVPASGMVGLAALAGLTDVDAITLSMAAYAKDGGSADVAVGAITAAALANTLVKFGMIMGLGGAALKKRMAVATALILVSGGVAVLLG